MKLSDITIILPTKNEERNIDRFLKSVPVHIPIIIVDASSDHTCEVVLAHGRKNIFMVKDDGGIASARQKGANIAQTEWLLFTDADVVFDENYFMHLREMSVTKQLGGIAGAKLSRDKYRCYYRLFSFWMKVICLMGIPAATGSNMLVRKSALNMAGGFDLSLTCNEDSYLMWRVKRSGYDVLFFEKLRVYEFDHRRLNSGRIKKTLHSMARCAFLFSGLFPDWVRKHDWNYWRTEKIP
jgi:glycosyltransferase involved in cell wall biosynthesis